MISYQSVTNRNIIAAPFLFFLLSDRKTFFLKQGVMLPF